MVLVSLDVSTHFNSHPIHPHSLSITHDYQTNTIFVIYNAPKRKVPLCNSLTTTETFPLRHVICVSTHSKKNVKLCLRSLETNNITKLRKGKGDMNQFNLHLSPMLTKVSLEQGEVCGNNTISLSSLSNICSTFSTSNTSFSTFTFSESPRRQEICHVGYIM